MGRGLSHLQKYILVKAAANHQSGDFYATYNIENVRADLFSAEVKIALYDVRVKPPRTEWDRYGGGWTLTHDGRSRTGRAYANHFRSKDNPRLHSVTQSISRAAQRLRHRGLLRWDGCYIKLTDAGLALGLKLLVDQRTKCPPINRYSDIEMARPEASEVL
jgi:hypothetical protein